MHDTMHAQDGRDDVIGEAGVAADMVDFIQVWAWLLLHAAAACSRWCPDWLALQSLLAAHPELTKLDFFVVGESCEAATEVLQPAAHSAWQARADAMCADGGHYVPAVSHAVWHLNKLAPGPQINLKGLVRCSLSGMQALRSAAVPTAQPSCCCCCCRQLATAS